MSNATKPNPDKSGTSPVVFSEFTKTVKVILEEVMALNDSGTHFPIFGICLGFEAIIAAIADDIDAVEKCPDCLNYNAVLNYTEAAGNSRLLKALPERIRELMGKTKMTYNFHEYMVRKEKFLACDKLTSMFDIISLSPSQGETFDFVSWIEAKRYPFYALQFHTELGVKCYFPGACAALVTHDNFALSTGIMAHIVSDAKKNVHRLPPEDESKLAFHDPGEIRYESQYRMAYHLWG